VLEVIGFLAQQSRNIVLFFYLQELFFSVEFRGFPFLKTKRAQRIATLILSGILALAIWFLISRVIPQIQGKVYEQ
jgi:hypothetical protein